MSADVTWFGSNQNQNIPGTPLKSETLTLSGTSAVSAAAPLEAAYYCIEGTEVWRYAVGSAPVATATAGINGHRLAAGKDRWGPAIGGVTKIAGIQAT